MTDSGPSVYEQLGDDGFVRLVAAFYRRVEKDSVLRAVYPEQDLTSAEYRLRLFLVQFFGGPTLYANERGNPRLRKRHEPFRIGEAERNAWVSAMLAAVEETRIPEPANSALRDYFEKGATFLMNASPSNRMKDNS
ncbi:MAG: globin domain-containing protein [Aggregatilineales bacterium]